MDNREYLIELYEIYKKLLTESQRSYFESYYYEDLSLNEIADNNKVTKSFVSKTINNIESKLKSYEDKLSLYDKELKLKEALKLEKDDKIKSLLEEILY